MLLLLKEHVVGMLTSEAQPAALCMMQHFVGSAPGDFCRHTNTEAGNGCKRVDPQTLALWPEM